MMKTGHEGRESNMLRKNLMLVYAGTAYFLSMAALLYIMGFLADFGVPKGISDGKVAALWPSVLIDAGLVGLFGLHHSITARTSFKRWWTKFIPAPIERATYLCMTTIMTTVLVCFWQPIPIPIWHVHSTLASGFITALYLGIWAMMTAATFHFGHFGFFGLAQAWNHFRQSPPQLSGMTARYLYALVRHPISLGWMVAPFATPHLTVGHVVFALSTVVYILLATPFEERDLIDDLGDVYRDYRRRVPAFLPSIRSGSKTEV
jgi:protein-S-isoprenylcysteine O-methyltransferase Ste14